MVDFMYKFDKLILGYTYGIHFRSTTFFPTYERIIEKEGVQHARNYDCYLVCTH